MIRMVKNKSIFILVVCIFLLAISCNNESVNVNILQNNDNENQEYEVVTIESDWFQVDYLQNKTYSIEEPQSSQENVSYLIIGDNKSIMFDTGSGENTSENGFKIKHIINQLTDIPLSLLLSHFHFDHNQNISEFSSVAFPDLAFLRQNISNTDVYTFTAEDLFIGNTPNQTQVSEWLPINTDIDLGNRVIQLVNIPGHTDESVAIIDKTNKMAFLGDYLYNGALFLFDNDDVSVYQESIDHLISILDSNYQLYGVHGTPEVTFGKLQELSNFLNCIQLNTCVPSATNLWGYNVLVYSFQRMQMVVFQ